MMLPKLLRLLLAPCLPLHAAEDGGGAVDRGDELVLADGAPALAEEDAAADAAAELAKIAADGDDADPAADRKKDSRIPLARHKEMLDKERDKRAALEAELARYKQGDSLARTNEQIDATETRLVELETRYTKLLADGEIEQATALMREIRTAERSIGEQKTSFAVQAAEARAVERVRYDTIVERLEASYPQLNPDADEFNQEQVQDVLDLKETYERRGLAPSTALQKAVAKTFGASTAKQEQATSVTPRATGEQVAAARKEAATKTALDAARRQPASTRDIGLDTDKVGALTAKSAMGMSQDQFAKLTEDQLAAMRGDVLA